MTGSGSSVRTVTLDNFIGDGRIAISISAGSASDPAGNSAGPAGPSEEFWVTNTVSWVDFSAADGGDGTQSNPFKTLVAALASAAPCETVRVLAGATDEAPLIISNAVRIEAVGGTVRIGVPPARSMSSLSSGADASASDQGTDSNLNSTVIGGGGSDGDSADSSESQGREWTIVLDQITFEPVVPFLRQDAGLISAIADGPLAIRVRRPFEIEPDDLWGAVLDHSGNDVTTTWKSAGEDDPSDVWVVFAPQDTWYAGDVLRIAAGLEPNTPDSIEASTYVFQVASANDSAQHSEFVLQPEMGEGDEDLATVQVGGMASVPVLDRIEPTFTLGPDRVFESPRRVWLPLPPTVAPTEVRLFYLHPYGDDRGWYPAENVEGWLVPDSYAALHADGMVYFGFLVRHSGVVQLAIPEG